METADFIVTGAGIIGLCIARELKKRNPGSKVVVLEKESSCALHASGRNSGVLHAGFYYSSDSLKARFTRRGNQLMTAFCQEHGLKIHQCGKLVVAKDARELAVMYQLMSRGKRNGVQLELLSADEARKLEPRVKTWEKALFSPTTSVVEPTEVVKSIFERARDEGIKVLFQHPFLQKKGDSIHTGKSVFQTGYFINSAGLHADKIALQFGFSKKYRIIPFKGLYLYSNYSPFSVKTHIYPVPDLHYPFLGVHFTLRVDGKLKIGPTAIPAFWREQYRGFQNFNAGEFVEILWRDFLLMIRARFNFKKLAFQELRKYFKREMIRQGKSLLKDVHTSHFTLWGNPGIRAQLINIQTMMLEMDFILEGDKKSLHVLNAVSPAFTCSIPFAEHVCDKIESLST